MIKVKDNIALYMASEECTAEDLAAKSGIEQEKISKILLAEEEPTNFELKSIADTLDININELIRGTDYMINETTTPETNKTKLTTKEMQGIIDQIKVIYKNCELWVRIKYNQYLINRLETNGLHNKDYSQIMELSPNTVSAYKTGKHAMAGHVLQRVLSKYDDILSIEHQLDKIKKFMALSNIYAYCAINETTVKHFMQTKQLTYFGSYRRDGIPTHLIESLANALEVNVEDFMTQRLYVTPKDSKNKKPETKQTQNTKPVTKKPTIRQVDPLITERLTKYEPPVPIIHVNPQNKPAEQKEPVVKHEVVLSFESSQNSKYDKIVRAINSKPEMESLFLTEVYKDIQNLYYKKSEEFFWEHYDELIKI